MVSVSKARSGYAKPHPQNLINCTCSLHNNYLQVQSLHKFTLELVNLHSQCNLFGGWAGEPNSKRCLEPDKFKESWKAVAPWPHTADMDLPTSLPTTRLKVVDHPVPGMLCTLCKQYTKVPHSGKAVWTSEPCTLFCLQSVRHGWVGKWVWSIVSASQKSCGKH